MTSPGFACTERETPDAPQARACTADAPVTVLIADDHALVRDGMRGLLVSLLGAVHCVEAGDGDALLLAADRHPGARLALVDLNMPGMERGQRLSNLARQHPTLPVVVVSALSSPDVVRRTLAMASVHAFVPKSAPSGLIGAAIGAALRGDKLPFGANPGTAHETAVLLTPRLEEVRQLLRQGMSNKQIALVLGIGEGTVKNHLSEIFRVLQVSNC